MVTAIRIKNSNKIIEYFFSGFRNFFIKPNIAPIPKVIYRQISMVSIIFNTPNKWLIILYTY
jgi:hypothetical protein